jgi:wyosine [tRNA(Phe)-imidazoG37] synthetase (radical SAM superfamily)
VEQITESRGGVVESTERRKPAPVRDNGCHETAFGCPRDFLDNRFVYAVVSSRARGLCVGVSLCPNKVCNFNCVYCEVDRTVRPREERLAVDVMAAELRKTLVYVREGRLRERPWYKGLPDDLLQLRHVALSGDGEPTLMPNFAEAVEAIVHVRALGGFPFFKLVLITNSSGLDLPAVQQGLRYLTRSDEIWAKLDGGTQAYVNRVNRPDVPLARILANILVVARQRPVVIQSLFPTINGEEPALEEVEQYAARLQDLINAGASISRVQVYSASRPTRNSECGHLSLKVLSRIAHHVRQVTGLATEVF